MILQFSFRAILCMCESRGLLSDSCSNRKEVSMELAFLRYSWTESITKLLDALAICNRGSKMSVTFSLSSSVTEFQD